MPRLRDLAGEGLFNDLTGNELLRMWQRPRWTENKGVRERGEIFTFQMLRRTKQKEEFLLIMNFFYHRSPEQFHFPHEWHVQPQRWTTQWERTYEMSENLL